MDEVGCIEYLVSLCVGHLGRSVVQVYLNEMLNIHGNNYGIKYALNWMVNSGFVWGVSLGVSLPF